MIFLIKIYPSSCEENVKCRYDFSWLVLGGEPSNVCQDCGFSRTAKVRYN